MKQKRRDFLRTSGIASLGLAGIGLLNANGKNNPPKALIGPPKFNMSGYAAPKLDKVRVGYIGVGNRGTAAVYRMAKIEGVEIKGISDVRSERVNAINEKLQGSGHSLNYIRAKKKNGKNCAIAPTSTWSILRLLGVCTRLWRFMP